MANTLALIVAIISTVTGVMNVLGWVNVVVDTLITVGFRYLLLVRKAA